MTRALPWLDTSGRVLPWHPTTGLVALGFRKNGDPIWPILGGDPVGGGNALLQRLTREHEDLDRNLAAIYGSAQDEGRDLTDAEKELVTRHKDRKAVLDAQIGPVLEAEEQIVASNAIRARIAPPGPGGDQGNRTPEGAPAAAGAQRAQVTEPPAWMSADPNRPNAALMSAYHVTRSGREYTPSGYRTFAEWARDAIISKFETIANRAGGPDAVKAANERLQRAPAHTLTSDVAGLLPASHMAQIMDVIDTSRPLVASGRDVPLDSGKLTYPKISSRPTVAKQVTEKTEVASTKLGVTMETLTAETFLGAGNLSWQAMNWSTPDALQLWFDLCAEDYAIKTEADAGAKLIAGATATTELGGAAGPTHTFAEWWAAIIASVQAAYTASGSRVMPNTVWASPDRFFQLLGIMAENGTAPAFAGQGSLNLTTLRGNIAGLTLIGSPGLGTNTIITGDARALLIGETAGAPVEMRAVEPAIGGMEVGLIGAFAAKVFDATRFNKIVDAV